MKDMIKKLYDNSAARYIVVGGLTTFVNLAIFSLLHYVVKLSFTPSNFIAILSAIIFAFITNKIFVFRSDDYSLGCWFREGITFFAGRLLTMIFEIIVPVLMIGTMGMNEMVAKILVQFLIVLLNYLISVLFVFKKDKEELTTKEWYLKNYTYIWVVGISVIVFIAVWIFNKLGPFGNHSMMLVDGIHQFTPFFSEYYEKMTNGGSLERSWDIGLGINFMSLFAYYLSSPFNLLLLLFGKSMLTTMINLGLTIKLILSGFTMAYYLKNREGEKSSDAAIIAFALAYEFNNFMIGYNWCTMWMDVIMIFPIIILGFERLVEKRDMRLYVIALFYALFCNYYIGFMVCMFMVIWYFVYDYKSIKQMAAAGVRFAIGSLMGGGMAAIVLLPAYKGIIQTASGDSMSELPDFSWYGNITEILKQLLIGIKPLKNQVFDGGANLYCGIFAILGAFLFFLAKGIHLKKKLLYLLVLIFLAISMNNELLNYIWHDFHNQYRIPSRFAFLFIFMLIIMSEEAFAHLDKNDRSVNSILVAAVLSVAGVVCLYMLPDEKLKLYSYILSIVLIDVYGFIMYLYASGKIRRFVAMLVFAIVAGCEIIAGGVVNFARLGSVDTDNYIQDTENVEKLKEKMEAESQGAFYRADLLKSRMLDEATWHNLRSVGIFGSTVSADIVDTMGNLGFYTGANEFLYHGSTPFTNALLAVKYNLVRPDAWNGSNFDEMADEGGVTLYRNPYRLPIGFLVDPEYEMVELNDNQMRAQNQLVKLITKDDYNMFNLFTFDCDVTGDSTGTFDPDSGRCSYERQDTDENTVTLTFQVPYDMDLYLNCKGSNIKDITFCKEGEQFASDRYQLQIFHVGNVKAGDYISATYKFNAGGNSTGSVYLFAAAYDEDVFKDCYDILSKQVLENIEFTDTMVSGTIKAGAGDLLFTSIPYDDGWDVYVDGELADVTVCLDSFLAYEFDDDAENKEHKIEFRYTTLGLKYGIIITIMCWLTYIVIYRLLATRSKREVLDEKTDKEGDHSGSGAWNKVSSGYEGDPEGDASDS